MIVPLNAITYGWEETARGRRFVVRMPKHTSASDKLALIDWLKRFADQIRTQHPYWIIDFQTFSNGYALDIVPTSSVEDFLEQSLRNFR
jgi:hypothetical protein